jgi:DNA-binding helix-hairpin-helix protein with protein kinase domain
MTAVTRVSPGAVARTNDGGQVRLGNLLGEGGEGAVFDIAGDPSRVAKVYFKSSEDRRAKLRALLETSSAAIHQVCTWPLTVIEMDSGQTGFLMAKLNNEFNSLDRLTSIRDRRVTFPNASWRFLLHTSQNLARAFGAVHEAGHVIGDVNESNVRVSPSGLVRLIDCDGFQISHNGSTYRCNVGVPTHTPPELQGLNFSATDRAANHDRFGLAIMVFQLLFMGRHPFAGVPGPLMTTDGTFESAIKSGHFAYLLQQPPTGLLQPKQTASLDLVLPTLADLFCRSFQPDSAQLGRPTVEEWIATLTRQRETLKRCNVHPLHDYSAHHADCPWCRLEASIPGGNFRYFATAPSPSTQGPQILDWASLRTRLTEALKPIPIRQLPLVQAAGRLPSPAVQQLLTDRHGRFTRESATYSAAVAEYEERVAAHQASWADAVAKHKAELQRYTDSLEAWKRSRDSAEAEYRDALTKYQADKAAMPPELSAPWIIIGVALGLVMWVVVDEFGKAQNSLGSLLFFVAFSVSIVQVTYLMHRSVRMEGKPWPVIPTKPQAPRQPILKEPFPPKQSSAPVRPPLTPPTAPTRLDKEFRAVHDEHKRAEQRLQTALSRATMHSSKSVRIEYTPQAQSSVAQLTSVLAQAARIEGSRAERVRAAEQRAQYHLLEAFLATKPIREGVAQGIGSQRVANLRYSGIRTAADINAVDLEAVPGIGPALSSALLAWRGSMERQYQPIAVNVDTNSIEGDIARELASLWPTAVRLASEVEAARSKILDALRREYNDVSEAAAHCSQTTTDVNALPT